MKTAHHLIVLLAGTFLAGCGRPTSTTPSGTSGASITTNSLAFEGTYIDTNYNDHPTITFKAGRYSGALPANPGGDMNGSGHYTAREVGNGKWELDLKYDTGGGTTIIVRKEGNNIVMRDMSYGSETKLVEK